MFISEAFFSHRTLKRRPWRKLPQKRLPGPERSWNNKKHLHVYLNDPMILNDNMIIEGIDPTLAEVQMPGSSSKRCTQRGASPTVKCCTKCWIEMSNPPLWYVYNIYYNIYIYIKYITILRKVQEVVLGLEPNPDVVSRHSRRSRAWKSCRCTTMQDVRSLVAAKQSWGGD